MLYALQWHWVEKERARRAEPIKVGHPVLMWVSKQQEDTRIVGQVEAVLGHGLFDVVVVKPNTQAVRYHSVKGHRLAHTKMDLCRDKTWMAMVVRTCGFVHGPNEVFFCTRVSISPLLPLLSLQL